jgi:hypothetical protein
MFAPCINSIKALFIIPTDELRWNNKKVHGANMMIILTDTQANSLIVFVIVLMTVIPNFLCSRYCVYNPSFCTR